MDAGAEAQGPSPEGTEHGVSLLVPEEEATHRRRRRERPAEIGRYVLLTLGAISSGAALALLLTKVSALVGDMLLGFGLALVALGLTLHLVVLRDRDRWPEQAHAWDEGIELQLRNGDVRAATWDDPKLALDIIVRPRRRSTEEDHVLLWRMSPAAQPCDMSEPGFKRLLDLAVRHDLALREYRRGRTSREPRLYEIRGRGAPRTSPFAAASGSTARTPP